MGCDTWRAQLSALYLAVFYVALAARPARAEETPLAVVGVASESIRPTVAPILVLRWPFEDGRALTASQVGWTTRVGYEAAQDPRSSFQSSISLTPLRAHLSHDVYDDDGKRDASGDFDDTSLHASIGERFHLDAVSLSVAAVVQNEWLSDYASTQRSVFDSPFAGLESELRVESLRSDEPFEARVDGIRVVVRMQALVGAVSWDTGSVELQLGRKWNALFFGLDAGADYTNLDTPVSNFAIGGAWDVLGASALHGHPLAAFRVDAAASGGVRVDLRIFGALEVGLRSSLLVGAPNTHTGSALLVHGVIDGLHYFAGVASPEHDAFRGTFTTLSLYGGVQGALFFSP